MVWECDTMPIIGRGNCTCVLKIWKTMSSCAPSISSNDTAVPVEQFKVLVAKCALEPLSCGTTALSRLRRGLRPRRYVPARCVEPESPLSVLEARAYASASRPQQTHARATPLESLAALRSRNAEWTVAKVPSGRLFSTSGAKRFRRD